jgi:hypothetical protein
MDKDKLKNFLNHSSPSLSISDSQIPGLKNIKTGSQLTLMTLPPFPDLPMQYLEPMIRPRDGLEIEMAQKDAERFLSGKTPMVYI